MQIELTDEQKYQIYLEVINKKASERLAKRSPEKVEADRIRHREYMREWARQKRKKDKLNKE